ncbi:hypothetical protein KJZ71_02375 [Patescibacteria group bacterium]|uniref:DUF304 domain-containing protein n=1 Tax=candidate division WWE3 bacterium TaxID=2053526 RepID=A0A928TXE3_UNCKA|nr:hypothetical protein [candidate division WWE3 bacterium]MCL4732634.1 hypothetical protein [Patescibacteria group bacterium]MDL1952712.1 hypothetical protein [Candidatus Uhrbacteria bacterium UHB]RIL01159.1 MAG: hypothetical protein DCC77_01290 [Candidatus Uhrbacteria bacterium]
MLKLENVIVLQKEEDLLLLAKKHVIFLIPRLTLALLLIVVPFFFLFPLFRTGPAGILVFLVLVCVGIFLAIRYLLIWDGSVLILTTLRVVSVVQSGVFNRSVTEISGSNIWDAKWEQKGILQNLMHFGRLTISAANVISADYISHPQEAHKLVNELIFRSGGRSGASSADRKAPEEPKQTLSRLQARLENMDDGELSRVEQSLKAQDRDIAIKKLYGDDSARLKPLDDEHEVP